MDGAYDLGSLAGLFERTDMMDRRMSVHSPGGMCTCEPGPAASSNHRQALRRRGARRRCSNTCPCRSPLQCNARSTSRLSGSCPLNTYFFFLPRMTSPMTPSQTGILTGSKSLYLSNSFMQLSVASFPCFHSCSQCVKTPRATYGVNRCAHPTCPRSGRASRRTGGKTGTGYGHLSSRSRSPPLGAGYPVMN